MGVSKLTYACSGAVEHVVGLPNDPNAYLVNDLAVFLNGKCIPYLDNRTADVNRAVAVAEGHFRNRFLHHSAAEKMLENGYLQMTIIYRGNEYVVSPCDGEAHDPKVGGMIDHCASCAPSWGKVVRLADGTRPSMRVHSNVMKKYERRLDAQKRLRLRQPLRGDHQAAGRGDDSGAGTAREVHRPARQGRLVRPQRQALLG